MNCKSKHSDPIEKALIAGLHLRDHNIEFIGNTNNQTVIWLQNGKIYPFKAIAPTLFCKLSNALTEDRKATTAINTHFPNALQRTRKVEIYTYFMYGSTDTTPDVIDGHLQPSENFRESEKCISLQFNSKQFTVNGKPLHHRYLKMIDAWCKGLPDKFIADSILNIGITTYDFHKSKLFKILNATTKPEAVFTACKNNIPCEI